jgi:hypothetical protein
MIDYMNLIMVYKWCIYDDGCEGNFMYWLWQVGKGIWNWRALDVFYGEFLDVFEFM